MIGRFFGKKDKEQRRGQEEGGLRYCPSCDTEYRPEIATCAHCNIALVSAGKRAADKQAVAAGRSARSMLIGPEDALIPLRQGSLQEMKAVQYLLCEEHIPSILSGDEMSCRSCSPQLTLEIKEADFAAARKVLAADFLKSTGVSLDDLTGAEHVFDLQAKEVTCPACATRFSPTVGACPGCGLNFI